MSMVAPASMNPVHVRLVGPEGAPQIDEAIRSLVGPQRAWTPGAVRLVAFQEDSVVGVAVYELDETALRVRQLALAWQSPDGLSGTLDVLLRAIDSACLAAGRRQITIGPAMIRVDPLLKARGYQVETYAVLTKMLPLIAGA